MSSKKDTDRVKGIVLCVTLVVLAYLTNTAEGDCTAPTFDDPYGVIVDPPQDNYADWDRVDLSCINGTTPSGPTYAYCDPRCDPGCDPRCDPNRDPSCDTGYSDWDLDIPTFVCYAFCDAADLDGSLTITPSPSENGLIEHGTTVTLNCTEPGKLVGPDSAYCNNGTWDKNDGDPYCTGPCNVTDLDSDLIITPSPEDQLVNPGTEVNVTCSKPGELVGSKSGKCENGKWEFSSPPSCAEHCLDSIDGEGLDYEPSPHINESNTLYYRDQEKITYSCSDDYQPLNCTAVNCTATCNDGTWEPATPPICSVVTTEPPITTPITTRTTFATSETGLMSTGITELTTLLNTTTVEGGVSTKTTALSTSDPATESTVFQSTMADPTSIGTEIASTPDDGFTNVFTLTTESEPALTTIGTTYPTDEVTNIITMTTGTRESTTGISSTVEGGSSTLTSEATTAVRTTEAVTEITDGTTMKTDITESTSPISTTVEGGSSAITRETTTVKVTDGVTLKTTEVTDSTLGISTTTEAGMSTKTEEGTPITTLRTTSALYTTKSTVNPTTVYSTLFPTERTTISSTDEILTTLGTLSSEIPSTASTKTTPLTASTLNATSTSEPKPTTIPTEKPPTDEPITDEPITEKPPTEKPPTEKPPTEKPPTEKPPTEKPPTEKPPTEKPPTEKPPTEKPPTEKPPTPPKPTESPCESCDESEICVHNACECRSGLYRDTDDTCKESKSVEVKIDITDIDGEGAEYMPEYGDPTSEEFKELEQIVCEPFDNLYRSKEDSEYRGCEVIEFSSGSIVVDYLLVFDSTSEVTIEQVEHDVTTSLQENGGNFNGSTSITFKNDSLDVAEPDYCGGNLDDCDLDATCETKGLDGFTCKCNEGFKDKGPAAYKGRYCEKEIWQIIVGVTVSITGVLTIAIIGLSCWYCRHVESSKAKSNYVVGVKDLEMPPLSMTEDGTVETVVLPWRNPPDEEEFVFASEAETPAAQPNNYATSPYHDPLEGMLNSYDNYVYKHHEGEEDTDLSGNYF